MKLNQWSGLLGFSKGESGAPVSIDRWGSHEGWMVGGAVRRDESLV